MKIAVWHNLNSGGGKRALYYHIEGLKKRGHEITSFCPDTVDQSYLPLSSIIIEKSFPLKRQSEELKNAVFKKMYSYGFILERLKLMLDHCRQCAAIINISDFDVLLSNSSSDFYMSHIGRFVNIPKAIYIGEPFRPLYEACTEFQWKAPDNEMRRFNCFKKVKNEIQYWKKIHALGILAREEFFAAASYDTLLVNSLYSRESIMRAYHLESKVCYLGIDTEKFKSNNSGKHNYVVGVGSFSPLKGIERAISVISRISVKRRPEFIWIGNLPDNSYINQLEKLAVKLNVKFTVKCNMADPDLISYMQKAAVMIYLPFLEPFGFVPLEANACGTAVVGIAEGGLRETITNNLNGYTANEFDADEIAFKIQLFTDNLSFAKEMGERSRKYVEEKWNYENGITNIENNLIKLKKGKNINKKA